MEEKEYVYETASEVSDLNENNIQKPHGYQRLMALAIEGHLNNIHLGFNDLIRYNLSWVLVSVSVEIIKPVKGTVKLYANTWFSGRKGPYFRREIVFRNENDKIMFKGSEFSILMDMEKRTIFRKRVLPFEVGESNKQFTINAVPTIKFKENDIDFMKADTRKVYNSYIDSLGHVNNIRYGEFAYDTFTDEERKNLSSMKRIDIFFLSELRDKDCFSIYKGYHDNKMVIRSHNETKGDNSFNAIFTF